MDDLANQLDRKTEIIDSLDKDIDQLESYSRRDTSGGPGLVDKVLALHAGSRGFDFHRRHMSERFSDPIDQDIRTQ